MKKLMWIRGIVLGLTLATCDAIQAKESTADSAAPIRKPLAWNQLDGQPVDVAPWAFAWRADREVQTKPEAYLIPRRLERLEKVYRAASQNVPQSELKATNYRQPDMLKPFPPKPKGQLQTALLWSGSLSDYTVELRWPEHVKKIPPKNAVQVRVYPTAFGWFGWTVDKILDEPKISDDGRTWTYKNNPEEKMDSSYDVRVPAATEMIAVFFDEKAAQEDLKSAVPELRIVSPQMSAWKRIDIEIEWGFQKPTADAEFDAKLEPFMAEIGPIAPLSDDKATKLIDNRSWRSSPSRDARRGVTIPLLYAPNARPGLDSRVTVWTKTGGFTIRLIDLDQGPILIPEQGVFLAKAGSGSSGKKFIEELAAKNLKSVRQMTRTHREASSWEEIIRESRLWRCPPGTAIKPYPAVPEPPMQVELSDPGWTNAWRAAVNQLRGPHMWGGLAFEVARVAHEMDMVGLHEKSEPVYEHFLKAPGAKSDGDYSDGNGALELATSMRHDIGYSHDGTHPSTGRLLFAMSERYFLTGDKPWFQKNRERLQAAADWIIRQRTSYLKDIPNRKELFVAGLMPPQMLGDYALPACDWHWYYVDNALSLQGLQRFAEALGEIDPEAGKKYAAEANAFRADLRRVVEREIAYTPVRLGRDGAYHSYLPRMAYGRGLTGPELGAIQFPDCDTFIGALPLAEPFVGIDPNDKNMVDTLDLMEEMGTSPAAVSELEQARAKKGLPTEDAWFWLGFCRLPKASHNANIYLLQDDVPNFLRFWMNSYALMVGSDGKFWEGWQTDQYAECDAPDNGTAGWFLENFRDMLVMEDGQSLWIARATPRAWLEQGKKIAVKNSPTYFGTFAYEIVSDAEHGKIAATLETPDRNPPKTMLVRFRHPKSLPIKSVTVNGKEWNDFDPAKETIRLHDVQGMVKVEASY